VRRRKNITPQIYEVCRLFVGGHSQGEIATILARTPNAVRLALRDARSILGGADYLQAARNAVVVGVQPTRFGYSPENPTERFWRKVRKGEECWEWTGFRVPPLGYGRFRLNDEQTWAHRVSWELTFGPIPEGLQVCHRCDNPPCVRPDHLFLGTPLDNVRDMIGKGRASFQKRASL
jgi:DNA-binding CsgD family transcriptional regulator